MMTLLDSKTKTIGWPHLSQPAPSLLCCIRCDGCRRQDLHKMLLLSDWQSRTAYCRRVPISSEADSVANDAITSLSCSRKPSSLHLTFSFDLFGKVMHFTQIHQHNSKTKTTCTVGLFRVKVCLRQQCMDSAKYCMYFLFVSFFLSFFLLEFLLCYL